MKLQDYREDFYTFSGKASDLNRQLAFAGIALIWLFKKDSSLAGFSIPHELLLPAILIVTSLALDMGHYVVASLIWRSFYRSKEKIGIDEVQELQHSPYLELPIYALFCAKIAFVLFAYCLLLRYLLLAISIR